MTSKQPWRTIEQGHGATYHTTRESRTTRTPLISEHERTEALALPDGPEPLSAEEWRLLGDYAAESEGVALAHAEAWTGRGREGGYRREAEEAHALLTKCRAHAEAQR